MNERLHNQSEHSRSTQHRRSTGTRLLQEELREARRQLADYRDTLVAIQRSILPQHLSSVPGLDLAVHFADADGVGGDFYDVRPVGPDHWAIVIADVSGHGLAAAVVLALVHGLGNAVQGQQVPPNGALELINKPLATRYLANTGKFVTAFAGLYDAQAQVLSYRNPAQSLFGDERLDAVLSAPANSAAELLKHVVDSVKTFRARRPANDDETCLVALVKPGPAATPEPRK